MDGQIIDLCASVFDSAAYSRFKGTAKLQLPLTHSGYLTSFAVTTEGKDSERVLARRLNFEAEPIVVFDGGCIDYDQLESLTEHGVNFVTLTKRDMIHDVLEELPVLRRSNVAQHRIIRQGGQKHLGNDPNITLLLVEIDVNKGTESFVALTNELMLAAPTIGEIHSNRWQIESSFK